MRFPLKMNEATFEADLDLCDVRTLYRQNRTSTPTRDKVCSNENLECWDNFGLVYDKFEPILCPNLIDSPISTTMSTDPNASRESHPEIDLSYGGQWAMEPPAQIQTQQLPDLVENLPDLVDGLYNFGISVFDSSSEQVSNQNLGWVKISPKKSEKLSEKLSEITPHEMVKNAPPLHGKVELSSEEGKWGEIEDKLRELRGSERAGENDESKECSQILERRVCHKKSRAELREEKSANVDDFRKRKLRIMVSNVRGFYSKRESAEAIFISNKVDVIFLCETLMTASRFPELSGYTTYFKNRATRSAGGVAIMLKDEVAKFAVKVDVGPLENEFIALKMTNTSPNLVLIVYYGQQATFGSDNIKLHLSQLLEVVKKYQNQGCSVNLCGDFNLHIGDSVLKNNHPDSKPNGRLFMNMIETMGLHLMNQESNDPTTFVDKSSKVHKRICLDFVVTNHPQCVSGFRTDDESHSFTPYSVKMRKKVARRTYADHFAIMYDFETLWKDRVRHKDNQVWNYKRKLGDVKFDIFTSNAMNFLLRKVEEEPSIDRVHKAFCDTITTGLFQSYGRRSITASKVTRIDDDLIWRKRLSEIDKLHEQFLSDKECNQIYKTKKQILRGQTDKQNVAVERDDNPEVLEDLEDILNYVLEYNVTNMEKVPPSARVKEIIDRKAEIIKLMLSDEKVKDCPQEIPWSVYLKVVRKVMTQRKSCFRHFIKSGRKFKYATWCYLNRMFRDEDFPESSAETWLTKIFKRKGSEAKLKNNRFVHGKEPFAKLLEKCVVELISSKLDEATPQLQAGSRKGRSTRDQLLKVIIMQKHYESQGKPLPVLLVDVQSCFDKMRLDDVIYDSLEAGCDPKATRVLRQFSDKTVIKLRGDHRNNGRGEGRVVTGTLGQGSNFAPPGIGLTSSKSIREEFKEEDKHLMARLGQVHSDNQSYVDDIASMPEDEVSTRKVSEKLGSALEVISLRSHPDKTEVVVSGNNKKAQDMREALTKNPAVMQGNNVKVSESGMYLGMKISQNGYRDSIDMTVKHRISKAWGKVSEIKAVINDARMGRLGWLRSGVTLIKAIIIPSLTYPADVWLTMYKKSEKALRDSYKSMVYIILDIPTHTKWTSVVADLAIPNIMAVVDKLRVNYINHTMWGKGDSKLREVLMEEHRLSPETSTLQEADLICAKYRLPKVSEGRLDKALVKRQIRLQDEIENWISNIRSPATQNVGLEMTRISTNFYRLPKRSSQALMAFNAGAFKLKTAWGDYHQAQGCLAPMCGGNDELEHIKQCPFYETKWEEDFNKDSKKLATYLVAVDRERRRKWKGECLF